jgi:biopolymer transport protein ExbD
MLPLINIVFLLILFFLMAGQVVPSIGASQVVAVSGGGESSRKGAVILLDADGRLRWDGELLTDTEMVPRAIDWSQRHPHTGIGVQADARTSADRVVQVFTMLQGAGIGEVRLLAQSAN